MSEATNHEKLPQAPASRRLRIYGAVLVTVFLLGFGPMWLVARERAGERDGAYRQLRIIEIENALAAAAIYARRGDYEPARQAASTFFTSLRSEVDNADSVFTEAQRQKLQPLLEPRDQMITLLARTDPAAAERLADLYMSYRQAR